MVNFKNLLNKNMDNDGLTSGALFEELEQGQDQGFVKIGNLWVGVDRRVPWEQIVAIRKYFRNLSTVRLRLDPSNTIDASSFNGYFRKAHWWGPKFNWNKVNEGKLGAITVYGDAEKAIHTLGFCSKTKFRWDFPKDKKISTFQVEEFLNAPSTGSNNITTRYLHSIHDQVAKVFSHYDVAVKTFTEDSYIDAYNADWIKGEGYEKLVRIDGIIERATWLDLVASYFSTNPLVEQYFDSDATI